MDFTLTPEHQLFGASLRSACGRRLTNVRNADPVEWHWRVHSLMGALDLFGLTLGNDLDGASGAIETMIVSEELGRWSANNEFVESVVLCGEFLKRAATEDQCRRWLRPLAEGKLTFSMPLSSKGVSALSESAQSRKYGRGYELNAHRLAASDMPSSDIFLIPAQDNTSNVVRVFGVSKTQAGVRRTEFEALDGERWTYLDLNGVNVNEADVIGLQGDVTSELAHAFDAARASLCAESLGAAEALFSLCCKHLVTRKQFGQPLADNQILRHRIADMRISLELMRSMACIAAVAVAEASPERRSELVWAAKSLIDGRALAIAEEAIQLHGAIGMSDECFVSHYARRILFTGHRLKSAALPSPLL